MAKTAKLKKNAKSTSLHSRAAKRASSPSIDLDKSLTSIKTPNESVLSVHHGAGITKKKGKVRPLSRQKRRRLERGVVRAEAVLDKTERKVERIKVKEKAVKERSSAWDELNSNFQEKKPKAKYEKDSSDDWVDEKMDEVPATEATIPEVTSSTESASRLIVDSTTTEVVVQEEEDEIL
ncbi:hypothetical protein MMC06_000281 [Schaereria dolodes]|nr:hypothetical protein [Schaereria dolodes]